MLDAIREYEARGWEVVALRGKRPALPWKEAIRWTVELRHEFFVTLGCNVGIATGKRSGIVVVDCDSREAFKHVLDTCKLTGKVVQTPRGGWHLYYKWPGHTIRNRVRIRGFGLDVRGDGGCVGAPPSKNDDSIPYRWLEDGEMETYDPAWLHDDQPGGYHREAMEDLDRVRRAIAYLDKVPGAVSGAGGHNATMRVAGLLIQRFGLSMEQAYPIMEMWNRRCKPPWRPAELLHKLESARARL